MSLFEAFGGGHRDMGEEAACTFIPPLSGLLPDTKGLLADSQSLIPLQNGFSTLNLLHGVSSVNQPNMPTTSSCYYCKKKLPKE